MNNWKCIIPPGEIGEAKICKFKVSKDAAMASSLKGSYLLSGEYTKLSIGGELVMSDTPKEWLDHKVFSQEACGDVLLNGLGLGCILNVLLQNEAVNSVTVVEKSKDVIALVGRHFPAANIIRGNAFTYKPEQRFDFIWHDIWADIDVTNLKEMDRLMKRYQRYADRQRCWSRTELLSLKRRGSWR